MRLAAAILLGLGIAGCTSEPTEAQQAPPRVTLSDQSGEAIPSFDGRVIIGDDLSVFGLVPRDRHAADPGIMLVELLDSQTTSEMHVRAVKIDAISFLYELDCDGSRYRLTGQVMYARSGQPIMRTEIDNPTVEGPLDGSLRAACGNELTPTWSWGPEFSSIEGFLSAADPILEPRRAAVPPVTITAIPQPQN